MRQKFGRNGRWCMCFFDKRQMSLAFTENDENQSMVSGLLEITQKLIARLSADAESNLGNLQ